jgi:DNA-binding HxlR family transcriptional regulator
MLKSEELISSSLLSARLKEMEENGLIGSVPHPESRRRKLYYLKPMGKDLIYVMVDMVLWSMKYLTEFLVIPKEKMELLQNSPDEFIKITLEQIEAWEKAHLT